MQLAQKDEPVPEVNLEDKHLKHAAARDPDKTYDKGHIAPHRGLQASGSIDPKQQQEYANYWLMQPVYTHEYTESVKPRHLPTETVCLVLSADLDTHLELSKVAQISHVLTCVQLRSSLELH